MKLLTCALSEREGMKKSVTAVMHLGGLDKTELNQSINVYSILTCIGSVVITII